MSPAAALGRFMRLPLTFHPAESDRLAWRAQLYVGAVVLLGTAIVMRHYPRELSQPVLAGALLVAAMVLSVFKLRLPLGKGASTMSMAHAVDFAALVTVGPDVAMVIAGIGVLVQCTVRVTQTQPVYRAAFSVASIVISVQAAGWVWGAFGGDMSAPSLSTFVVPLSAAAIGYFAVNTSLVAGAIAVTTAMSAARQWYREFFWSAPAYFLSAAVAGMGALIVNHDTYVLLPLAASPLYISYKAYRMSVDRLEAERTHARDLAELIGTTQKALKRATQSEAALAAEKDQLALESGRLMVTLRTISDGVVSVDTRGSVLLMNEGAEALTGFSHDPEQKRDIDDVLVALGLSPRACRQAVVRVLDEGLPVRLRTEPGDEDSRLVEVTGTPNRDADGQVAGTVWVLRDLTDIARIEHERAKTARLESLGVLAGGLAHDFNNILMGVVGNLSLAQSMARPDDTALLERLTSAATACNRARGVTNQLLTFSKGGAPVKTAGPIHELVTECARFCLSGSPVAPKFDVPPDVWSAEVDTGQIGQVVQNLVLNAMQAMRPFGGVLEIGLRNVEVHAGNQPARTPVVPGRYVCLTVKDTGKGIAAEHLLRIFDPYFTTKEKGSGLGLAISYSIVRAHGGVITVESEVDAGSLFSVYLPASGVTVSAPAEARPRTPTARLAGGRVLLMDDEPMVGEVAQQMLESLGYEAVIATSGTEAIDMFREAEQRGNPFVAVILDLTVPGGMGGAEAVTHIKAIRANVPAVVTSGYADDPVMARYRDYGFDSVLPKPFPIPALRRALEELEVDPASSQVA